MSYDRTNKQTNRDYNFIQIDKSLKRQKIGNEKEEKSNGIEL